MSLGDERVTSADGGDRPPGPHALISRKSWRRILLPGQSLTFGRGASCDLQVGHAPPDPRIPRTAGELECRSDGVLIRNRSAKQSLTMQVFPGPELEIRPLALVGTHPHDRVRLLLHGRSATISLMIDVAALGPGSRAPVPPQPVDPEEVTTGFERIKMSDRQRLLLTVLCLPALTQSGHGAEVPSYAEMAETLKEYGCALRPRTVRNNFNDLREWLTEQHDIPGLVEERGDDAPAPGGTNSMIEKLAEWALRSGNATREDVDRLG